MKESAQAAIAYLRSNSARFGVPADFHEKIDLHVHVLEGAPPKDGPSAGIAMASAVISALTRHAMRGDVALTGEITLRGRVLPIGGLKEKLLAAHQAGIDTVIIPQGNEANLEDVPEQILEDLKVVPVSTFYEVLEVMLLSEEEQAAFVPPKGSDQRPGATPPAGA